MGEEYEYTSRCRTSPRRRRRRGRGWALMLLVLGFAAGLLCGRNMTGLALTERLLGLFDPRSNVPEEIALPAFIQEDLLSENPYSRPGLELRRVNDIVIHYVGNPNTTAAQNRSYFQGLADSGATYASSNLIVGLEGECLLTVPLNEVAYCSNDRNEDSISIEFCHPDDSGVPTEATYDSLVRLTAWLLELYGLDEDNLLRHYDVSGKGCPRWFVDSEPAWEQFRADVAKNLR